MNLVLQYVFQSYGAGADVVQVRQAARLSANWMSCIQDLMSIRPERDSQFTRNTLRRKATRCQQRSKRYEKSIVSPLFAKQLRIRDAR